MLYTDTSSTRVKRSGLAETPFHCCEPHAVPGPTVPCRRLSCGICTTSLLHRSHVQTCSRSVTQCLILRMTEGVTSFQSAAKAWFQDQSWFAGVLTQQDFAFTTRLTFFPSRKGGVMHNPGECCCEPLLGAWRQLKWFLFSHLLLRKLTPSLR